MKSFKFSSIKESLEKDLNLVGSKSNNIKPKENIKETNFRKGKEYIDTTYNSKLNINNVSLMENSEIVDFSDKKINDVNSYNRLDTQRFSSGDQIQVENTEINNMSAKKQDVKMKNNLNENDNNNTDQNMLSNRIDDNKIIDVNENNNINSNINNKILIENSLNDTNNSGIKIGLETVESNIIFPESDKNDKNGKNDKNLNNQNAETKELIDHQNNSNSNEKINNDNKINEVKEKVQNEVKEVKEVKDEIKVNEENEIKEQKGGEQNNDLIKAKFNENLNKFKNDFKNLPNFKNIFSNLSFETKENKKLKEVTTNTVKNIEEIGKNISKLEFENALEQYNNVGIIITFRL